MISKRMGKRVLDVILNNDLQALQMILVIGVPLDSIIDGKCLLCIAVELDRPEVVQYLLEKGANMSIDCSEGSPVYKAVKESNLNILRMLLQHKGTGPNHVSCLITALYNGEVETVETLLQHGWDVNGQIPSQGRSPYTPIHVPYWHPRLSEPPSYRYPFENKEVPTENDVIGYNKLSGGRPLHMAIVRRFGTAVSLLLDYGADVNAPTDRGFTPLQQAVRTFFPKQGIQHGGNFTSKLDCILQLGTINSDSSEETLMCIGKLMAHTLFLNRAGIYRSKLQNAVHFNAAQSPLTNRRCKSAIA
ncbi:unnamed protein product [Bemisia tabaci]|uniref:Uncharacterized protein n=1 Tax=Bemisia tabaci TaxID=7038 RepID=A0A9P0F8I0_BEMTA|nr:unnamed protein product [Bemisia tabaci]